MAPVREDPRGPTHGDLDLATFPLFVGEPREGTRFDAEPPAVVRERFAGRRARSCGLVETNATGTARAAARACVGASVAAQVPFAWIEKRQGTDSGFASGYVGVREADGYQLYALRYDSDPCGGSCPEDGQTSLERCERIVPASESCLRPGAPCFACAGVVTLEDAWVAGKPAPPPLATPSHELPRLFGAGAATLGPLFDGLQLGASTPAEPGAVARAAAAVEAGGLGWLESGPDEDPARLDGVGVVVAGRCGGLRDQLVARWGASPDLAWVDAAGTQRAWLTLARCAVRVERVARPDAWVGAGRDAVVPLGVLGMRGADLRARLTAGPHTVTRADDGSLAWTDLGVGRTGTRTRLAATVVGGVVTRLEAEVAADVASLEAVRAALIALRGTPTRNTPLTDTDAYVEWPGTPKLSYTITPDGNGMVMLVRAP